MSSEAELKALLSQVMKRLEAVTARLEKLEGSAPAGTPAGNEAPAAGKAKQAYLDLIEEYLKPVVETAKKFNENLGKCMTDFMNIANEVANLIGVAEQSKKPSQDEFQKLIMPIGQKMGELEVYKKDFKNEYINYITAAVEAVQIFSWVCVEKTPGPYAADIIPSAEFYTNKILVQNKGKDQEKYDWAINFIKFLKENIPYIKNYHTTGLAWNPKGGNVSDAKAAAPAGGVPPPPSIPVAPIIEAKPVSNAKQADTGALFAQINQGTGISSGLKHVTDDMKNKNIKPEDRKPLEPKKKAPVQPKAAPAAKQAVTKPPKCEKNGFKWDVSYQQNNNNLVIESQVKESMYIYNCSNSTIFIKGKINCVSIDGCKKCNIICDTVVSYVEMVNCTSIDLRINEVTKTITVDKSQSVNVHLSQQCVDENTIVNTSKCDAINIAFPNPKEPEDEIEIAVPEQFFTVVKDGKLFPQIYFHDTASYVIPK